MKIGCITTSTIPSTTANSIQVMKVCQALQQLGHEVILLSPGSQPSNNDLRELYGMDQLPDIRWIPEWKLLKRYDFIIKAVSVIRREKVDVLYTWAPQAAWLGSMLGSPTILEMHDRATGKFGPVLVKAFLKHHGKNLLVSITNALVLALEAQLRIKINPQNVQIAPNGVDLERYQDLPKPQAARKQLGYRNTITVGYTGHFYAGRGLNILFALAKEFPQLQFLWVGGRESELGHVREMLAQDKLDNVILTGFIPNHDLPLYQAAADILIMPYEREIAGSSGGNSADICSPMKMFEYMAANRVIISSDLPVIKEVLKDEMAYYCPPEEPQDWINQVKWILEHPADGRNKAGIAAHTVSQYTVLQREERILAKFEAL